MATNFLDPGGGSRPPSYANRVKTNMKKHQKLDRNILEIIIEKKNRDEFILLRGEQVAEVCEVVGVNVASEAEGYHTQYGKFITLSVWVKQAVSLTKFVSSHPTVYTSELTIVSVKPAVAREVTVLDTRLHFNTPDSLVREYLQSFGTKLANKEPVYGV